MQKSFLLFIVLTCAFANAQGLSGRRAPSFALPDPTMKQFDILDYRGRWLLLDFMRTECDHCKQLTKTLDALKAKLGAKIAVLAVVEPPENTATVSKYKAATKTTTPILFDSGTTAMWYFHATPAKPAIDNSPHLFAINPQGTIVRDWSEGAVIAPGFAAELEALINGAAK